MNVSNLTEWVGVFLPDIAPDGQGGYVETIPSNLTEDRPANVRQLSGRQGRDNDQTADRVEFFVTIRYDSNITTDHRVSWRSRFLDITLVDDTDLEKLWLKLTCVRREKGAQ
jgi:SPP1 family predicted phage head-tail adaptor